MSGNSKSLRITLGTDFDSGSWPGPMVGRSAVAGEAWVGPVGLLSILETQLGLGGPRRPAALRSAALIPETIKIAGFWSQSAGHNPLATARTLLRWRDRLWMQGWRGEPLADRLAGLATVTRNAEPGFPDRLASIVDRIASHRPDIESIQLCEVRAGWPPLWHSVFDALERVGVEFREPSFASATARGDLSIVHKALAGSNRSAADTIGFPQKDGSLQLLRPHGPMQAAEEVAAWLTTLATHSSLDQTVLIGADPVLDRALRAHGLPTTGAPADRCSGALLQILPLVLALGWDPPDPQRALELLTLPVAPGPWEVRRRLIDALGQWPAVGSDDWNQGLEDGLATIEDQVKRSTVRKRLIELLHPTVSRGTPYPATEIAVRTQATQRWLMARKATDEKGQYPWDEALAQCRTLLALVEASGITEFSAPQLDRFANLASQSVSEPAAFPAQAGIASVTLPGAVAGPARFVVWWDFDLASAQQAAPWFLSPAESRALEDAGIPVPDPGSEAVALAERWRRPLHFAQESVLLVCPATGESGGEQYPHPMWDELTGLLGDDATKALTVTAPMFANEPARVSIPHLDLPAPRREWTANPSLVPRRARESVSSLSTFLGCSLKWSLQYPGGLRAGRSQQDSGESALLGSLLHEIVERVLIEHPPTPEAARDRAHQLFDELGPKLVAPFYLPGSDALRGHARRLAGEGARHLSEILAAEGRRVVSTEATHYREAFDGEIGGRLDLVVGDPPGIIDLKLGSGNYRRKDLQNGVSGLALYGYALKDPGGPFPPSGYFIFSEQVLLSTDTDYFPNAEHLEGPTPEETWKAWEKAAIEQRAVVDTGRLEAPGNPDSTGEVHPSEDGVVDGRVVLEAPCHFCDFKILCGLFFEEARA